LLLLSLEYSNKVRRYSQGRNVSTVNAGRLQCESWNDLDWLVIYTDFQAKPSVVQNLRVQAQVVGLVLGNRITQHLVARAIDAGFNFFSDLVR
jgi:hypothetical protein